MSNKSCFLEVKTLRKSYGRTTVLDDVSFEIKEGEFVCFLGPSGCGKTTLLLCLAGLEQPDSGDIQKRERSLARIPPSGRDVGIVFQSYALFPNLSVKKKHCIRPRKSEKIKSRSGNDLRSAHDPIKPNRARGKISKPAIGWATAASGTRPSLSGISISFTSR